MIIPGKSFQPGLMFVISVTPFPSESLHSRVDSWPYPEILDQAGNKHASLLQTFMNYGPRQFYNIGSQAPGACSIKHYRSVMWGKWADFVIS